MLRPRLRIPRAGRIGLAPTQPLAPLSMAFAQSVQAQSRAKHSVPPLGKHEERFASEGISGFLGPASFDLAWTQYQTLMLQKLDEKTAETEFYDKDLKPIILATAREPQHAAIFNYASMAHNNHFFFDRLAPEIVQMPEDLQRHLEMSFGSIETLRREMIYTADAMFGPGFVWLVKTAHPGMQASFKVLTTYLAGTPYAGAHWRAQDLDANTDIGSTTERGLETGRRFLENTALGAGRKPAAAAKKVIAPGGIDVHPVLCLNTWEHVWLPTYGLGLPGSRQQGKLEYAENWWYRIDWEKVARSAALPKSLANSSSSLSQPSQSQSQPQPQPDSAAAKWTTPEMPLPRAN